MTRKARTRMLTYKASKGGRKLSRELGVLRLKRKSSRFRARTQDVIVNWGKTELPDRLYGTTKIINHPDNVAIAANKIECLTALKEAGIEVPKFTTEMEKAKEWARNGRTVVCRTLTRASAGRGIVLANDPSEVVYAPLYTMYRPKFDEYRVHVVNGVAIDVQQKRRRHGSDYSNQIRTAANGWVYCRTELDVPIYVYEAGIQAVRALGLDFGAVDIGYTRTSEMATVYEVNTAPGLEGTTLELYREAFRSMINDLRS